MKVLLMMAVVQSLNLVIFAWFNRVAGLRILMLRQQLTVYKRRSKKPMLRNRGAVYIDILDFSVRVLVTTGTVALPA